jgi:hypothetical protein
MDAVQNGGLRATWAIATGNPGDVRARTFNPSAMEHFTAVAPPQVIIGPTPRGIGSESLKNLKAVSKPGDGVLRLI